MSLCTELRSVVESPLASDCVHHHWAHVPENTSPEVICCRCGRRARVSHEGCLVLRYLPRPSQVVTTEIL